MPLAILTLPGVLGIWAKAGAATAMAVAKAKAAKRAYVIYLSLFG
jgi:hypothetical protein